MPAYLADLFGTQMVGAIHGRLLTAWAAASLLGPILVNYIREYQLAHGVPKAQAYDVTMYVLAALVLVGVLCNLTVRPVALNPALVVAAWGAVGIPLAIGVWITLQKAVILFQ